MSRTWGSTTATISPCTTRRARAYPKPVATSALPIATPVLHRSGTAGAPSGCSQLPCPAIAVNTSRCRGMATTPATTVPSTSAAMLTAQSASP